MTGPTLARPGTLEKLVVLAARATARMPLFDVRDAGHGDEDGAVIPFASGIARLRRAPPPSVRRVWLPDSEEAA